MSNDLVKAEQRQVDVVDEQTIKDFLFGSETKLSPEQHVLFIKTAVAFKLNPFKREIYAVPFQERSSGRYRLSIVTGYETYLKRADRLEKLSGWETTTAGSGDDMVARITIWRKDWTQPFKHEVMFKEYRQENKMWREKPVTMIKKVVTAQGFRLCFPDDMGGLPYTADELPDEMTQTKIIDNQQPFIRAETKLKSIVMDKLPIYESQSKPPANFIVKEKQPQGEILFVDTKNIVIDPEKPANKTDHMINSNGDQYGIKYRPDTDPNYYTEEQHNLIMKMIDSHCLTPTQVMKFRKALGERKIMSTRASELIAWLNFRIKTVKKAEDHLKDIAASEEIRRKITRGVLREWDDTKLETFVANEAEHKSEIEEDYREINDFLSDIKEPKNVAD